MPKKQSGNLIQRQNRDRTVVRRKTIAYPAPSSRITRSQHQRDAGPRRSARLKGLLPEKCTDLNSRPKKKKRQTPARQTTSKKQTPARQTASTRKQHTECIACMEIYSPDQMFAADCRHWFCRACARKLFLHAINDKTRFPPRCCYGGFPKNASYSLLKGIDYKRYQGREEGISNRNAVYCPQVDCGGCIPQSTIDGDDAVCPHCEKGMHIPCGAPAHPGKGCPNEEGLQELLNLASSRNWRRCPSCRMMVEHLAGTARIGCQYVGNPAFHLTTATMADRISVVPRYSAIFVEIFPPGAGVPVKT